MSFRRKRRIASRTATRTSAFRVYRTVALAVQPREFSSSFLEQRQPATGGSRGCAIRVNLCATRKKGACDRDDEERTSKRNRTKSYSKEQKQPMNRSNGSILVKKSRRPLGRRPRARRKDSPRATEKRSVEEIGDFEVKVNDSFTRREGLVYAALRVWELNHGFGD